MGVDSCIAGLNKVVTPDMNASLLKPFSEEGVNFALSQMHPLKAPGPDGYDACF